MIDQLLTALRACDFDKALSCYLSLWEEQPEVFDANNPKNLDGLTVHRSNAASLARKRGYDQLHDVRFASDRIAKAVDRMFGLLPATFEQEVQQPNFLYVPNLKSSGFFEVDDIPGLASFLKRLSNFVPQFQRLVDEKKNNYVDLMGHIPDLEQWNNLKQGNWLSQHVINAGGSECINIEGLDALFSDPVIADCPPHAPEAFISYLLPKIKIPPHFGLSNVKLTVHVPINVNQQSSLTVGDETRTWSEPAQSAIIFDDSFQHSARNMGEEIRSVLIFDIWNPFLSEEEKVAIRKLVSTYQQWFDVYGKLAALDGQNAS